MSDDSMRSVGIRSIDAGTVGTEGEPAIELHAADAFARGIVHGVHP